MRALKLSTAYYDSGSPVASGSISGDALKVIDQPSVDNAAMLSYWQMIGDIVNGQDAIVSAGKKYLPQFPTEADENYNFRQINAKFTNVYRDVVEGLASKPFDEEVKLGEKVDPQIEEFCEDVDGAGTNLTGFAVDTFFSGINDALSWIFVDYPDVGTSLRTKAQDKAIGARPYLTHVLACNMLEVQSQFIGGKERLTFVRLLEIVGNDTFVRVFFADAVSARWELYKKVQTTDASGNVLVTFVFVAGGPITIGVIPLVPFVTGRRKGKSWQFFPPMRDAADLQIKLYQAETGLDNIKAIAAFPVFSGNGVTPDKGGDGKPLKLGIGPGSALYAPASTTSGKNGAWVILSPDAGVLTFLQTDVKATIDQLRELGRQPLTAQSGNITVIAAGVAAGKANSAVGMWALGLKNALENALVLVGMWMKLPTPDAVEVDIFTDWDMTGDSIQDLPQLLAMRAAGDLTQETYYSELIRRGTLSSNFDIDAEVEATKAEALAKVPVEPDPNAPDAQVDPPPPVDKTVPKPQA